MAKLRKYKRGEDVQLSPNFHLSEFECHCGKCDHTIISLDHVDNLQRKRKELKKTINITSAFRCEAYNKKIGGATHSQHKLGMATDIQVKGMTPDEVADACEDFSGLGRYNSFTHLDSRENGKARWDLRKK